MGPSPEAMELKSTGRLDTDQTPAIHATNGGGGGGGGQDKQKQQHASQGIRRSYIKPNIVLDNQVITGFPALSSDKCYQSAMAADKSTEANRVLMYLSDGTRIHYNDTLKEGGHRRRSKKGHHKQVHRTWSSESGGSEGTRLKSGQLPTRSGSERTTLGSERTMLGSDGTDMDTDHQTMIEDHDEDNDFFDQNALGDGLTQGFTSISESSISGGSSTDYEESDLHYITTAAVNGFVPIKHVQDHKKVMAFIVEVTWSDGRTHMVKRTFTDFYSLHLYLVEEFTSEVGKDSPLRLTYFLPERGHGIDESSIEVAEARELQLNRYVQELIKLPQQISACPTVLTFFESRGSDPKPYRETVSPSSMNLADQYMLCWI